MTEADDVYYAGQLDFLLSLDNKYVIVVNNDVYHKNNIISYPKTPFFPRGNNTGLQLDHKKPLFTYNHINAPGYENMNHIHIISVDHGRSDIYDDVASALEYKSTN